MLQMNLTKKQDEVLHFLWQTDSPQSMDEITEKSGYGSVGKIVVEFVVNSMLHKGLIHQTGIYRSFLSKTEIPVALFAPGIEFAEYYSTHFKNISPKNLFHLLEKLLKSDKLDPAMIHELSRIINERDALKYREEEK